MARLDEMIADRMRDAIVRACGAEHADVDPLIRPTQDARYGDFQANVAMSLAKRLGKKPRDVADALVAALDVTGLAATPTIAGPGFVNFRVDDPLIGRLAGHAAADARLGLATTRDPLSVVVDYSGPNVAKDMHVGHLRSSVIGDAIRRKSDTARAITGFMPRSPGRPKGSCNKLGAHSFRRSMMAA